MKIKTNIWIKMKIFLFSDLIRDPILVFIVTKTLKIINYKIKNNILLYY